MNRRSSRLNRSRRSGSLRRNSRSGAPETIRMKAVADRLIVDSAESLTGTSVLVILLHGTTLATALRQQRPDLHYTFYTPEHFFFSTLRQFHPDAKVIGAGIGPAEDIEPETASSSVRLVCAADPPDEVFDNVVLPTSAIGSAEQTQELLQIAHQRLRTDGCLVVATNNPKDKWLKERMIEVFGKVSIQSPPQGVVYVARKTGPLKRERSFRATFAFRLQEQLVELESVPGVFSHRRVDGGARALIRSLELLAPLPSATGGDKSGPRRIVELGCGSGAVSIAAALRFPPARVLAVDSHARAVQCTRENATRNQLDQIDTLLRSDAVLPEANTWDLVLTNPPYYADYRISELFLLAAVRALRPGGQIHLVTKLADWHLARMNQLFHAVQMHRIGEYDVLIAVKR